MTPKLEFETQASWSTYFVVFNQGFSLELSNLWRIASYTSLGQQVPEIPTEFFFNFDL